MVAECNSIVFPARAGMNRRCARGTGRIERVPRTRGDEPELRSVLFSDVVFPARAGMNRIRKNAYVALDVFPARAGMNRSP